MKAKMALGIAAALLFIGVLLLVMPWLLFWSVEAMTGYHIPLTFRSWAGAILFLALVRGDTSGSRK